MIKGVKKNALIPIFVLVGVCFCVASLIGVVNIFTEDTIRENADQKIYDSLRIVIDGKFEPIEKPDWAPKSVVDI